MNPPFWWRWRIHRTMAARETLAALAVRCRRLDLREAAWHLKFDDFITGASGKLLHNELERSTHF